MLIYDILSDKKEQLKFIGKSVENVELIGKQITEFKKHGITTNSLKETIESLDDKYLITKMQDMLDIYEEYDDKISSKYIDENDGLSILVDNLELVHEFRNCDIYIDEFVGFTKQEYEILRSVFRNNNNIYITVCIDKIDSTSNPDVDVFYANKQTLDRLFSIAKQEGVSIDEPICLEKKYRFKSDELQHLEQNIYAVPYQKYTKPVQNIELFLANNQYSEIEHVAEKIVKLARDEGYCYNEISVITKSIEEYSSLCRAILGKYNIPVFIDEKKDLSQNLLVRYLLAVIQIFAKNWTYEAVFEYVKSGFLDIDWLDINILENYCLKWGIKGSKWHNGEWFFYDETDEEREKILHIRQKVIAPLLELKGKLSGTKDVKTITEQLYQFLIDNEIDVKIEKEIINLEEIGEVDKAKEYETSLRIVRAVFDEIVLVLGEKKVSFSKYAEILKMGLGNSSLGKIPGTQDQVIVGDIDRSRTHKARAVFIIGLNDGGFPSVNRNEGFFNDIDREKLKENGAELAKGTLEKLYDDNFNIYKAFGASEEKLYLSYASSDLEGKSLRPSILINKMKKVFPDLKEMSDVIGKKEDIITEESTFEELLNHLRVFRDEGDFRDENPEMWFELYNYYSTNQKWKDRLSSSMKALNYTNQPKAIMVNNIEKLYGSTLKTSISKLEQYQSCPFSYYLKYGLKLSDKNEFKIGAIDTGTFMHEVIDEFFEKVEIGNLNIKQITDEEVKLLVDEIIEEKLQLKKNYIFTSIPKYRILASRLKKVIRQSMKYIVDSLKYSEFEVLGHEIEFKKGKQYEPIEIVLDNGKKVEITGKIDRIDIAKTMGGNYIRIIDYKSSIKDINLNEVVAGLQLQLLTYMDAVCTVDDVLPAGMLYFNLIEPTVKANSHMTDEEIEQEIRKQFKMKGMILADSQIIKMMDTKLEKGSSDVVPAYIDKEGNVSSKSNAITRVQFEKLQKHTKKMLKQISAEILSGKIDVQPYYKVKNSKTPCEYCKYHAICQFNNGICKNSYNYIKNINKDAILEGISSEGK